MKKRTKSALPPWLTACTGLVVLTTVRAARADDVLDELTLGALSSNRAPAAAPFASDRVGGSVDANDELTLSLDGTFTHYFKANHAPGENIFLIDAAGDYAPNDHFAFGLDARASPPSTTVTHTPTDTVKSRTSLLGAGVSAEYDTAGDGPVETIADTALDLTSFSTTQRSRKVGKATPSSLQQYRVSGGVTEVLWADSEVELSGAWYGYSTDPVGTGYFGTSVFGRGSLSDGLPLEPIRWSVRPTLRQRFGPVRLSAFFQYGRYVGDTGLSLIAGLKAQLKVSDAVKVWASVDFQRDEDPSGETLSIPWGSLGVRVNL